MKLVIADSKTRQRLYKTEDCRPIALMNIGAKILKILASRIQQYMKRVVSHEKVNLFQGCKDGSLLKIS